MREAILMFVWHNWNIPIYIFLCRSYCTYYIYTYITQPPPAQQKKRSSLMQTRKPFCFLISWDQRSEKTKRKKKKSIIAHSLSISLVGFLKLVSAIFFFRKVLEAQVYYILHLKERPVGRERKNDLSLFFFILLFVLVLLLIWLFQPRLLEMSKSGQLTFFFSF